MARDCIICGEPVVLRDELCLIWLKDGGKFLWETFKDKSLVTQEVLASADVVLSKREGLCHSCWGSVLIAFERGLRRRLFEESI